MWGPSSNHPSHGNEVASHEAVGLPFEFWSAEEIQKRLAFDLQSYGPQAGGYTFCWIDEEPPSWIWKARACQKLGLQLMCLICLNIFRLIGHLSILVIMGYRIIFWDWRLGKPHRSGRQVRIDDDSFGEATGPALTGGVHFPLTGERVNTEHRNHHVFWNVTSLTAFHAPSQNRARSWSQLDIYIYI